MALRDMRLTCIHTAMSGSNEVPMSSLKPADFGGAVTHKRDAEVAMSQPLRPPIDIKQGRKWSIELTSANQVFMVTPIYSHSVEAAALYVAQSNIRATSKTPRGRVLEKTQSCLSGQRCATWSPKSLRSCTTKAMALLTNAFASKDETQHPAI